MLLNRLLEAVVGMIRLGRTLAPPEQANSTAIQVIPAHRALFVHRWQIALLIAIIAACFYAATLPRSYSADDLQYAMVVEQFVTGRPLYHPSGSRPYLPNVAGGADVEVPSTTLLNPRYLLEFPTSALMAKLWLYCGWQGTAIAPIQFLRLLAGACGLMFFYLAISGILSKRSSALVAVAGLAISSAYWTYSTHLDQSINMIALICLSFLLLMRLFTASSGPKRLWPLVLSLAAATFFNFTAVITAAAFGLAICFLPAASHMQRFRRFIGFGVLYVLVVCGGIALAIAFWTVPANLTSGDFWRAATFSGHPEYGVSLSRDTLRAILGFGKSQVAYPPAAAQSTGSLQQFWDGAGTAARLLLLGFYGALLALLAAPTLPLLRRPRNWLPLALLGWIGLYSGFNLWWDPGYTKYWLIPLVSCWTLIALGIDRMATSSVRKWPQVSLIAGVCLTFALAANLTALSLGRQTDQAWPSVARQLRQSESSALFISASAHPLDFNLAFFAQRDVVSLPLIRYGTGGDEGAVKEILAEHVAQHQSVGGPIYIYGLEALGSEQYRALLSDFPEAELRVKWQFADLTIYEVTH